MGETNTNITRFLKSSRIAFELLESEAVKRSAVETAELFHLAPEEVCKSIVLGRMTSGKHILVIIPGPLEVDHKKVAAFIGEKKVRVTTQNEAEAITGMQSGGISPFGLLNKGFQFLLHDSVLRSAKICVSGGQRGLTIRLSPTDLIRLTKARTGDFALGSQI